MLWWIYIDSSISRKTGASLVIVIESFQFCHDHRLFSWIMIESGVVTHAGARKVQIHFMTYSYLYDCSKTYMYKNVLSLVKFPRKVFEIK
jgi:hypothetical protein